MRIMQITLQYNDPLYELRQEWARKDAIRRSRMFVIQKPDDQPWTVDILLAEAAKYKSRGEFADLSRKAYMLIKTLFPGAMDAVFPPRPKKIPITDEGVVREAASKYTNRSDFARYSLDEYNAARAMGIMDDLGFGKPRSGFDTSSPAKLYLVDLILNDKSMGVMLGITNRDMRARFAPYQIDMMPNRYFYQFSKGVDAKNAEVILKTEFKKFSIPKENSPIDGKFGNSGEIITGKTIVDVTTHLASRIPNLPPLEQW
jgi:hypothetical protein